MNELVILLFISNTALLPSVSNYSKAYMI